MDLDSESKSKSELDLKYDLDQDLFGLSKSKEPLELSELLVFEPSVSEPLVSKPSLEIPTPCLKHSIRAQIQAATFLELGIPHLEITKKTGISKS
jgi:hypothetical protein